MNLDVKSILPYAAALLIAFGVAFAIGFGSGPKDLAENEARNEVTQETSETASANANESTVSAGELNELAIMALLNRELAVSSDKVGGTENPGFCGLKFEALGQVLRALQSSLDFSGITQEEIQVVLVGFPVCDEACEKQVCESKYYKDLYSKKDSYGSIEDGH